MGRSLERIRMAVKDVSARWMKATNALKKEAQVYGQRVAEMAKKHSNEAFYCLGDPPEVAVFSVPPRPFIDTANTPESSWIGGEPRAGSGSKPEGRFLVWCYFHSQTNKWKFPASSMSNSHTPGTLFSLANLGEEACQITPPRQLALRPLPVDRPLP